MNVTVLSAWGSPVSTAYLKALREIPNLKLSIIYDYQEKLQSEIARIYRERFGDLAPVFLSAEEMFGPQVATYKTVGCNSPETLQIVSRLAPDLMVLGGAGIVKKPLLDKIKIGTLNCHPGQLPRYRGCTCVEWALFEDEPVAATCHFVTEEIDAGPIVLSRKMPIYREDSYVAIRLRMFHFQAEVLRDAVKKLITLPPNEIPAVFEPTDSYYKPIDEEKMNQVFEKLRLGKYPYYESRS